MRVKKKIIANLKKAYCVAPLQYHGVPHILVASEKNHECLLFDRSGNQKDVVWSGPGGTMSMVQLPDSEGAFLATQRFYSPNDSKQSEIVLVTPKPGGGWQCDALIHIPHIHRFDILTRRTAHYLIVCTICSGRDYKDDWSYPGEVYVCQLPDEISGTTRLTLSRLMTGLYKNHGYFRWEQNGESSAIVTANEGVFHIVPPESPNKNWETKQIVDIAASDVLMADLDNDGREEMVLFSPFHGDNLLVYKQIGHRWKIVYHHPLKMEFLHALCKGTIDGASCAIIGHRKGNAELILLRYENGCFTTQVIDNGFGPANVSFFTGKDDDFIVAANRETDQVALYTLL